MITVTISRIPAMMMHENTINALSVCLSVFTGLVSLCVSIVVVCALCVWLIVKDLFVARIK